MNIKPYGVYKICDIEWVGEIPKHWETIAISRIFQLGRGRVISRMEIEDHKGEYPVYSSQTENNGVLGYIKSYDFEGNYLTWTTDGANAGTVFYRTGKFNCTNVCGTLKPKNEKEVNLSYLRYSLSIQTKQYVRLDINPKLMNNEMAKIKVVFPPVNEQETIANYLDNETFKIDNLIEKKQRLIELLQEKRQALITNAVTKGLDPNVPMKDSGVSWLGEVPEHWKVKKLKYWVEFLNHRRIPLSSDERHDLEKVYPYYGASGIIDYVDRYLFNEDSILIAEDGANLYSRSSRLAFIAKGKYWVNNHAHILKPIAGDLMYWSERLESIKYDPFITGSAQPKLSLENLASIEFAAPDNPVEQVQIGKYINKVNTTYDILISKIQTQLTKLKEYRQALITSAVTGKIDVREKVSS